MSTTTSAFPSQKSATTAADAAKGATQDEPQPGGRRRTLLLAGLAVLAVLVVGGIAWFLLAGGDDEVVAAPPAPAGAAPSVSAAPTQAPTGPPIARLSGVKARNPFVPLVTPKPPAPPAPAPSASTAPTVSPVAGPTAGTGTGTLPTSSKAVVLQLVSLDKTTKTATYKVDGRTFKVSNGSVFATYFKLVAVTDGSCTITQYGDVTVPTCVGSKLTLG